MYCHQQPGRPSPVESQDWESSGFTSCTLSKHHAAKTTPSISGQKCLCLWFDRRRPQGISNQRVWGLSLGLGVRPKTPVCPEQHVAADLCLSNSLLATEDLPASTYSVSVVSVQDERPWPAGHHSLVSCVAAPSAARGCRQRIGSQGSTRLPAHDCTHARSHLPHPHALPSRCRT